MNNPKEFLGFEFVTLTLDHQEVIQNFFTRYPQKIDVYTFASLIAWSVVYHHSWTSVGKDTLLMTTYVQELNQYHLLQPIGAFGADIQRDLLKRISESSYPIKIYGVSKEFIETHEEFCSYFYDDDDRSMANYLYQASDLALLAGRRFEKKRNLISQIDKVYQWTLEPLQAACPDCPKILTDLGSKNPSEMNDSLKKELQALNTILTNYDRLHLKGYMIGIDGKPVAFSVVDVLNPTTKVVLFEKADKHFKGLFQLINRETSRAIFEDGYEFINREEDLGIEGLRKAKLSYCPIELVPSHILTFRQFL